MPLMNGYSLVKAIREVDSNIAITMISNHDDKEKLQQCIPLGLCGYLFKPLNYEDIKSYLSSFKKKLPKFINVQYKFSDNIVLDFSKQSITVDHQKFSMTKLESTFLELMSKYENRVINYNEIFDYLDEFDATFSTIKNLVYRLKAKYQFSFIKNIKNVGYILVKDD